MMLGVGEAAPAQIFRFAPNFGAGAPSRLSAGPYNTKKQAAPQGDLFAANV